MREGWRKGRAGMEGGYASNHETVHMYMYM